MLRGDMIADAGTGLPFIGRDEELRTLLHDINSATRSRWLITGEPGIGKTRLMREVILSQGDRCRFFSLRGVGGPGEEPFELVPELEKGDDAKRSLIVFDDIDAAHPIDLPAAGRVLDELAIGPVLMTARDEDIGVGWNSFAQVSRRMKLSGLSKKEVETLLAHVGIGAALDEKTPLTNPARIAELVDSMTLIKPGIGLQTVLGPDGLPLRSPADLLKVEISVSDFNVALLSELEARPELMRELSPRRFEELVAELYSRNGFEVELTRASKDGGVDIYAVQRAPFGSFLTIVDCKRHRADRPVQVGLVRKLYGTVVSTGASVGVIATTSYFSSGAKEFQEERRHRIGLQDFVSLKDMLHLLSAPADAGE